MSEEVMTNTEQAVDNTQPAGNGKAAEKHSPRKKSTGSCRTGWPREDQSTAAHTCGRTGAGACLAGECFELSRVHREKQEFTRLECWTFWTQAISKGSKSMAEKLLKVFPESFPPGIQWWEFPSAAA